MSARSISRLIGVLSVAASTWIMAATALYSLAELTDRSKSIFLVKVSEVGHPGWKNGDGAAVALASADVIRHLKGEDRAKVVMAFLTDVSDQPQLVAGQQYLVFALDPVASIYMGHQVRAFPISGGEVLVTGVAGENGRHSLATFERKVRDLLPR